MVSQLFKSYPHLSQIDKYSKKVAKRLFEKCPEWLPYARVGQYQGQSFLEVEINAPVKPTERDLIISTYDYRITIHFDWFHAHFGGWEGLTVDDTIESALSFIDELFEERVIVGIKMENGKWAGSKAWTPKTVVSIQPGDVTYTRSWLGTYDQDYED